MTASVTSSSSSSTMLHNGQTSFTFNETGIIGGVDAGIRGFPDPTLAGNAMTLPAVTTPVTIDFRSATLGSGAVTQVQGTIAALTIPSGATLGTVNAVQSTIVEVVMNNGGTLERAVVNLAGGNDLSETGVISTTAISASATAANVFYSNTARSNLPYRVVRTITSTQTTAGTWASAPTLVQGQGGNALTAMMSLGYGQTWQNVTASRAVSTTYYNTTGKPITVTVNLTSTTTAQAQISVAGTPVVNSNQATSGNGLACLAIVPAGASYSVNVTAGTPSLGYWGELR